MVQCVSPGYASAEIAFNNCWFQQNISTIAHVYALRKSSTSVRIVRIKRRKYVKDNTIVMMLCN